jgi:hypothetical protein
MLVAEFDRIRAQLRQFSLKAKRVRAALVKIGGGLIPSERMANGE